MTLQQLEQLTKELYKSQELHKINQDLKLNFSKIKNNLLYGHKNPQLNMGFMGNMSDAAYFGVGGWKELDRTTLGSDNGTIAVSIADKRYLMVLTSIVGSSGNTNLTQRYNADAGNNYAARSAVNGAADGTETESPRIFYGGGGASADTLPNFAVNYIANLSGKEKLMQAWCVDQNVVGDGTTANRDVAIGKWANTAAPITTVTCTSADANTFDSGSEVVVLGWDPVDIHTDNFWGQLASDTLGSTGDIFTSSTFTAKKYLWIQAYLKPTGTIHIGTRFNGDSANNYCGRLSENGAADSLATNGTNIATQSNPQTTPSFINMFVINNSANEKLVIMHTVTQNTAGAANATIRDEVVGKWVNTADSITSVTLQNFNTGDILSGAILKVWGAN